MNDFPFGTPGEIEVVGGPAEKRYAVRRISDGRVMNIVLWDGVRPWAPPEGQEAVQSDTLDITPEPPPPPTTATRLQLRRVFRARGIWEQVRAAIYADEDLKEEWELATEVDRDHPLVTAFAAAFGWNESELIQLFIDANATG